MWSYLTASVAKNEDCIVPKQHTLSYNFIRALGESTMLQPCFHSVFIDSFSKSIRLNFLNRCYRIFGILSNISEMYIYKSDAIHFVGKFLKAFIGLKNNLKWCSLTVN